MDERRSMALEHIIIKNLISKEISEFLYSYLNLKKTGVKLLREYNIISSLDRDHGIFGDGQLKGTPGKKIKSKISRNLFLCSFIYKRKCFKKTYR
jgi:hypothetical protein